ncbi:hypothetical protein LMG32289_00831 [Cupriavidus pampae]|uniref:DUF302 domain-containing protein n=2 Tax=Cupriavidus pampae TaxID=659251 RepID=A0ABN7XVN1_9BURK|nr:hypothetical protein LMG32289_00831 [Cupriavidus pampae]
MTAVALGTMTAMSAQAQEKPYPARTISLTSQHGFATTVDRLKSTLASRGLTLFADIDQSAAATQAGTSLRPTRLFLFGNPKGGTPAMQMNPHAAVELPLRAVVWQDERGTTHIDYQDLSGVLAADYGLSADMVAPLAAVRPLLESVASSK